MLGGHPQNAPSHIYIFVLFSIFEYCVARGVLPGSIFGLFSEYYSAYLSGNPQKHKTKILEIFPGIYVFAEYSLERNANKYSIGYKKWKLSC